MAEKATEGGGGGLSKTDLLKYAKLQAKKVKQKDAQLAELQQKYDELAAKGTSSDAAAGSGELEDANKELTKKLEEAEIERKKMLLKTKELLRRFKLQQEKLEKYEEKDQQQDTDPEDKISELTSEIAALQSSLSAVEKQAAETEANYQEELRLLKENMNTTAQVDEQNVALNGRVKELEASLSAVEKQAAETEANYQEELRLLKENMNTTAQVDEQNVALNGRVKELEASLSAVEKQAAETEANYEEELRLLKENMNTTAQVDEQNVALNGRIKELETSLSAVEKQAAETEANYEEELRLLKENMNTTAQVDEQNVALNGRVKELEEELELAKEGAGVQRTADAKQLKAKYATALKAKNAKFAELTKAIKEENEQLRLQQQETAQQLSVVEAKEKVALDHSLDLQCEVAANKELIDKLQAQLSSNNYAQACKDKELAMQKLSNQTDVYGKLNDDYVALENEHQQMIEKHHKLEQRHMKDRQLQVSAGLQLLSNMVISKKLERDRRCFGSWKSLWESSSKARLEDTQRQLEETVAAQEKEAERVKTLESHVKKLKTLLSKSHKQMQEHKQQTAKSLQCPAGFDSSSIRCRVRVDNEIYCCVQVNDEKEVEWHKEQSVLAWLIDLKGVEQANKELPMELRAELKDEAENRITIANQELASAMMELEKRSSDLAQYKRRANLALQKAQREASGETKQKLEDSEKLIQQLQAELGRLSRNKDTQLSTIEALRGDKASLELGLSKATREIEELKQHHDKLQNDISEMMEKTKETLRVEHENRIQTLNEEHKSNIQSFHAKLKQAEQHVLQYEEKTTELAQQMVDNTEESTNKYEELSREFHDLKEKYVAAQSELEALKSSKQEQQPKSQQVEVEPNSALVKIRSQMKLQQEHNLRVNVDDGEQDRASYPSELPSRQNSVTSIESSLLNSNNLSPNSNVLFAQQFDSLRMQHEKERRLLTAEIERLREELEDSETQSTLFVTQINHLKEQIREADRTVAREKELLKTSESSLAVVDEASQPTSESLTYLKNVIFKYMCAGENSERETLLPVVATMLKFSPEEVAKCQATLDDSFLRHQTQAVEDIFKWGLGWTSS